MSEDSSSVRVAVRIRPPLTREIIDGCQICTSVSPGTPQVWIGGNHAFTYDYVFDSDASQESVFQTVTGLVDGCLEGYNATILAYGQTGSGKTHTMGTGFDVESLNSTVLNENQGIIPRAVYYLFHKIDELRKNAAEAGHPPPEFKVSAQFVELYNEEVFDLIEPEAKKAPTEKPWVPHFRPISSPPSDTDLTAAAKSSGTGMNRRPQTTGAIKIHEDPTGGIYLVGIGTKNVETAESTMKCLRNGALCRTTASTNMNDQSSRSHAIFTLHIKQQRVVSGDEPESQTEFETLTAKFHFVDLAGSERLKRTGAVGERAKEGITINMGLLALGNVISALGDTSKKVLHVPYRDSKLTRLLQDSLGGNSRTVMIACVSPCDRDFVETLNTLKYANRARNIKNRITINQDKSSRTIALLKQEIQSLQNELLDYKQGKRSGGCGDDDLSDTWRENVMLLTEITSLKNRVKAMQETIEMLTTKNSELLAERIVQDAMGGSNGSDSGATADLTNLVKGYMQEIEELRAKLMEAEATCETMRKNLTSPRSNKLLSPRLNSAANYNDINDLIEEAKKEVEKEQDLLQRLHNTCEDSSASDTDDEDTENEPSMAADIQLANVTNEISMKLRLIEQLEQSQARMEQMRNQYEQKLTCLMNRIKATEQERDKVLGSVRGEDKVKQVKEDYEKKLASLNSELKKWQSAQKEHARVLRNQSQSERQINTLRAEIDNMKRIKVKLMNQIKEEGIRWRDIETKRVREINQLKKEQRKKDIAIRALEGEARKKDVVLKRKLEEVNALKKIKAMSAKASGQVHLKVSPVKAKQKWGRIMTNMVKNVTTKQTLSNFEQEMLSLIEERKALKAEIDSLMKDKVKMQMEMASPADLNTVNEYIDNLSAKIAYVEEKVNELQRSIVELTSAREDEENPDLSNLVAKLNNQEIGYVFNKLYEQSVASMTECANSTKKETEAQERLKHTERELIVAQDLLRHIMLNHPESVFLPPELLSKFQSLKRDYQYEQLSGSTESLPGSSSNGSDATFFVKPAAPKSERKARRLTATPSELLMGTNGSETFTVVEPELPDVQLPDEFKRVNSIRGSTRGRRNTYVVPPGETFNPAGPPSNDSARSTNSFPNRRPAVVASGVSRLKATNNNLTTSDRMNTTFLVDKSPEHDRYESPSNTPPGSPNSQRRTNNDNNVFQRLFGSQGNETGGVGIIRSVRGTSSSRNILLNVSVAEGHSKPVLSVFATEDKLFTGSKDSTAKIWDLTTGTEIQTLTGHPNNVLCVRYIEDTRLVLTTSHCYIKVWDFRMNGKSNCIKTLCSSGVMADESVKFDPNSRLNLLPNGEQLVNCVCVGPKDMFTPFGDRVRRWDLRKFQSVGLLAGRHGSAVTCMALDENSFVTGSKDHSIKVYEYSHNTSSTGPSESSGASWTLEPPHYDGIETFAMQNRVLFSGSRDTCIKRWDLHRKEMVVSINNAHGGWITGLAFAPKNDSVFLSSGRDGMVKIWSVENCRELGKVDAHKGAVNCLATNSSLIFTGSQEGPIHIWKLRKSMDAPSSPESSDLSP